MIKRIKYFSLVLLFVPLVFSCGMDEFKPYDHSFFHIMKDGISSTTVSSKARVVGEYKIYLSSKPLSESVTVEYSIIAGDGLTEGVDYELITSGTSLNFLPGIYDMPIRIKWLPHTLDSQKNNTLTIRIESNSLDLTMGLPGKDQLQREFTITKKN
uniref:hypothetical protein n=1 Tax=uncultured Draconibacterium sp. TaxID=1573823 RepID=UPI003217C81A